MLLVFLLCVLSVCYVAYGACYGKGVESLTVVYTSNFCLLLLKIKYK